MKWQQAEEQLRGWKVEGCGEWPSSCPITHAAHSSYIQVGNTLIKGEGRCPGLTRAAHNLMFSRMYEGDAKRLREEMARL